MEPDVEGGGRAPLDAERVTEPAPVHAPAPAVRGERGETSLESAASAEAFKELAIALRSSVETMHGVRDLQAELVRSLKRQDRSEMILQSTQTLNETFRNLTTIQRELVKRLEGAAEGGTRSRGGSRAIPLMMLGLLVVFLGGIWVVLDVLDQMKTDRPDTAVLADQASERTLAAFREGRDAGAVDAERNLAALQDQLGQMEERERALRGRLEEEMGDRSELLAQVRGLEMERDHLASQIRAAQNEAIARRAVEDELREATSRLAVLDPQMLDLEAAIAAEKSENARLRHRLAALGLGRPDPDPDPVTEPDEAADPTGPPADVDSPSPEDRTEPEPEPEPEPEQDTPAAVDETAVRIERDPQLLAKLRARLNQMLDNGSRGRADLWQVTRIDGVRGDGLDGVIALRYDRKSGKLVEQVRAQDLRFFVDQRRNVVEVEFRNGRSSKGPASEPFQGGKLTQQVAQGAMTRLWTHSGMPFIRYR